MQKHDAGHRGVLYRASGKANPVQNGIGSDLFPDTAGVLLGYCKEGEEEGGAAQWVPRVIGRRTGTRLSASQGRGARPVLGLGRNELGRGGKGSQGAGWPLAGRVRG